MWQTIVAQHELQANFAGLVSQIKKDQELVVLDEKSPVTLVAPVQAQAAPELRNQLHIRFAEFEFPFP